MWRQGAFLNMSMSRKTIYIAGPMAGIEHNNVEAFDTAARKLSSEGWFVINPADFDQVFGCNPEGKLLDAVCESERAAIPHLDAIYLLKGWQNSKSAKRELFVALEHNLMVFVEGEES